MKILYIPINEIKNKDKKKKDQNEIVNINEINHDINNDLNDINDENLNDMGNELLNKYVINKEEEIKFYESRIVNLKKINVIYKSKKIKKNVFKNEININLNISQDTQNNNELSMINQANNNENLESNINNTFYELFTVESVAKSGIYNSTFIQDEDIYK